MKPDTPVYNNILTSPEVKVSCSQKRWRFPWTALCKPITYEFNVHSEPSFCPNPTMQILNALSLVRSTVGINLQLLQLDTL